MRYKEQSSVVQLKLIHRLRYSFDIVDIKNQMCITKLNERLNECIIIKFAFCIKSIRPQ